MSPIPNAKPPVITEEIWDRARAARLIGKTWKDISKEVGVKENTLKVRWHRENMPAVVNRLKEQGDSFSEKISQNCEKSIDAISRKVRELLAADSLETAVRLQGYAIDDLRDESLREQVAASLVKRSATVLGWADASANVQVQVGILASLPDREQIEPGPTIEADVVQ